MTGFVNSGTGNDVAARVNSALRRLPAWVIYICGGAYASWLFWLGLDNRLGANPVEALEHLYGEAALYLLIAGLAVTPLRRFTALNLIKFRRAVGLTCFFFVVMHLSVWAVLDVQSIDRVWQDILKRPYITVGMAAFVLMVPLAITSNNLSLRRLGPSAWRRLHRLTYAAGVLGAVHYVMLVKGWQIRPLVFLAIILLLLALRLAASRSRASS